MRVLASALASIAALWPGLLLGFELGQWAAPEFCPAPNGPNLCALLGGVLVMGLVPLVLSGVVGAVVWRAMAPSAENSSRLQ